MWPYPQRIRTDDATTAPKLLLLEQWSRGVAEIAAAQRGGRGFVPALCWPACKRLVDFDFVMVFAYCRQRPAR